MNGLHGIIFSYKKLPELRELVEHRMPASVPFGGRYRVIDFMLSNMRNAGITDVGVVLHGNYQSLLDHLGNGKTWDMARNFGGLALLPPFADNRIYQGGEFRGKMEALAGVMSYLEDIRQDHVVLADGDLIVNLPLEDVLDAHIASGADITAVCTANTDFAGDGVYFALDKSGKIVKTRSETKMTEGYRALGIYVMSKKLLLELVRDCEAQDKPSFHRDVLQGMADRLELRGFVWDGYAAQLRSLKEYYDRSFELLRPSVRAELFPDTAPILAKEDDESPSYIAPDSIVRDSLVADGCNIEGSVEGSILFPEVVVEKGAEVHNCILFKGVHVHAGAVLRDVIADKSVEILPDRTLMGHENYPLAISKGNVV